MHEWKAGMLHSGSKHGPIVKKQKQALAIAFSEQRKESPARRLARARMKGGKSKRH